MVTLGHGGKILSQVHLAPMHLRAAAPLGQHKLVSRSALPSHDIFLIFFAINVQFVSNTVHFECRFSGESHRKCRESKYHGVRMVIGLLRRRAKKRVHSLPEGVRIYAIGDVHGRADLLGQLLSRIEAHIIAHPTPRPVHVLIGDYIDRGPRSREVLDLLINCSQSREMIFLRGNHDVFIRDFIRKPALLRDWSKIGGLETLMSYGLQPPINADADTQKALAVALYSALPARHRAFLNKLVSSFTCGGYFFAHAGVRPGIPLAKQHDDDLLWIRDDFLLHEEDFGKIVVHGHTPVREIDIRPNRINIDTGAYVTGRLSCLILEGDHVEPL